MLATPDPQLEAFRADVLAGLAAAIPAIPARWLYDRRGSELFDEITRLPSYYPTLTETALLTAIMPTVIHYSRPTTQKSSPQCVIFRTCIAVQ